MAVASLRARQLLCGLTAEALAAVDPHVTAAGRRPAVYAGVDPTAPSLHLGNMVVLMALRHFQRAGFRPILLIGGATALIGDPSGRSTERRLLDEQHVADNIMGIKKSVSKLFDFDGPDGALLVNNMDFYRDMSAVAFVRDVGRHFRLGAMLSRDSVRARLEGDGLSFTEFSYQLFQSHDFAVLAREHGCVAQLGGSDQWGNITAGVDLVRRTQDKEVFGVTVPLLTTSTGEKFGKSAGNAVWLNEDMTSHYDMYQFLLRTTDEDVGKLLLMLTLVPEEEVAAVVDRHREDPSRRIAQQRLADEVVTLIRGRQAALAAKQASAAMFGDDQAAYTIEALEALATQGGVPTVRLPEARCVGVSLVDVAVACGLVKSKAECRRLISAGGVYLNGSRVPDASAVIREVDVIGGRMFVMRTGKRQHVIVVVVRPGGAATSVISIACEKVNGASALRESKDLKFHGVWLRDNCRCTKCLDQSTLQRQVDTAAVPLHVTPLHVSVGHDAEELRVVWPENPPHVSVYPAKWLSDNAYWSSKNEGVAGARDPAMCKRSRVVFEADSFRRPDGSLALPHFDHDDVMASDHALYGALKAIRDFGFVTVTNTPKSIEGTAALSQRVGFIRPTVYSLGMWTTEVLPDGIDTAYTPSPLVSHTDGCYWDDQPGIQVFHCLKEDPEGGGKTQLVDGFKVAQVMKEKYPRSFDLLSRVKLPFHHIDSGSEYRTYKKVFELDEDGDVVSFTFNNQDRSVPAVEPELMEPLYLALQQLIETCEDPALSVWFSLTPGMTIFIHNTRVLHGRSEFRASSGRLLAGCYMNNEEFRSKLRVLARRFESS